ncbi:hypothetical protein BWGOE13_29290 [Bacillus mycoides]|uniref:Uncharacterized protein n=1 Tax=Bacillus mycoides TaxID=1405 RepID=A0A1E8BLN4_BACMY|nr:AAA family ATPase [Bacillus mycoides]OFD92216.1 hypothetical protein BWGOE11_29600 [Bacillus mycoides]OFE00047.1 hypothetical protein BWGOE13_29290 [Bacillus mycoides]
MSIVKTETLSFKEKKIVEDTYLIGRLVPEEYKIPIRIDESGNIRFVIQSLSPEPNSLKNIMLNNEDTYITYDNRQSDFLNQYNYFNAINKKEKLEEILKDKLLVFKPVIRERKHGDGYFYNFNIQFAEIATSEKLNEKYVSIPIISNLSKAEFEECLLTSKTFILEDYNHSLEIPEFILCENYIYQFQNVEHLRQNRARSNAYICDHPHEVMKFRLTDEWQDMFKILCRNVYFISITDLSEIRDWVQDIGVKIIPNLAVLDGNTSNIENKIEWNGDHKLEKNSERNLLSNEFVQEYRFIENIKEKAYEEGLIYKKSDIVNLHMALKTSNFSILGGMSGTGKTQLARIYAETLGLEEGETLLTIPVSPAFTEPSDLLGYLNQQAGIYLEADTGLVSFLKKAENAPDKMFMVIFDEMNLGQVEHYFSDFISLLELPENNRVLKLFAPKSHCIQDELRKGISIGRNVLFVGTANLDETTKDFSNRMLDRSNLILLEKLTFSEAKKIEQEYAKRFVEFNEESTGGLATHSNISTSNFKTWIHPNTRVLNLSDEEVELLDQLHLAISNYDSQTGVSFRIVKSIGQYLSNIPINKDGLMYLERMQAFDYQIKQRILTKVRGHREQIQDLVGMVNPNGEYEKGELIGIISEFGTFSCSRDYIIQKAKELMRNGYTL